MQLSIGFTSLCGIACGFGQMYNDVYPSLEFQPEYIFIFCCAGSLLLRAGFPQLWQVAINFDTLASHCGGFSCGAQDLSARASVVVTCELSALVACGILLDQGSSRCPLCRQADSQPHWTAGKSNPEDYHCPRNHLCSTSSSLNPSLQPLVITELFQCLHSYAFSRKSYSWDHTVCSLFRLASFTQ